MKLLHRALAVVILALPSWACDSQKQPKSVIGDTQMMVRIAAIEIDPDHAEEYLVLLTEESEASVRLEAGVVAIYPMYERDNPSQIRLLEIYASREAYEAHLATPHFQKYKTETLKMVKSLELIEMVPIDAATMPEIFVKLQQ